MLLLCILTFLDLVGFGIIMPMIPVFVHNYNLNNLQIGILVSSYFFGQFFGSISNGYLSDIWGKKQVLVLSLFCLSISYFFNGFIQILSNKFYFLVLIRFIIGYFSGYIAIIFATVYNISNKDSLVKNMSYLGSAFTLGFIFGPTIGGYLSRSYDSITPYYYTAGFYTICLILVIIFFKNPIIKDNDKAQNILASLKELLKKPKILLNLGTFIFFSFALSGIEVFLLTQTLGLKMGYSPLKIGLVWTYFAIILTIIQIFITKYIPKNFAIVGGLALFGISTILLSFSHYSIYILCIILIVIAFSLGVLFPNINAELSLQGSNRQKGLIFGMNCAAESIGGFLGPYILSYIYNFTGLLYVIWLTIGIIAFILSTYNAYFIYNKKFS